MRRLMNGHGRHAAGVATAVLLVAMTASGCITTIVAPYSGLYGAELRQLEEESIPYHKKGSGTIVGMVTIDAGGTQIVAPEGTQVMLTPATTFAHERLQEDVIDDNELPERVQAELVVSVRTDGQGRFKFAGLAAGSYILASAVPWGDDASGERRKDVAYGIVDLDVGQNASIVLTRRVDG